MYTNHQLPAVDASAIALARKALRDRYDLNGDPLFDHAFRVYQAVPQDDSVTRLVALLHTIREHGRGVDDDYIRGRYGKRVADAVHALTRPRGLPLLAHVAGLTDNQARVVKRACIADNLRRDRLDQLSVADRAPLYLAYTEAQRLLEPTGAPR